ncbi:hypothetical protein G6F56_014533 [Rhizopus delemar]|nr:hypothetical protein G6F56_014533 [Rhizopus delemar]
MKAAPASTLPDLPSTPAISWNSWWKRWSRSAARAAPPCSTSTRWRSTWMASSRCWKTSSRLLTRPTCWP